ncbi:uncharacterized protein yc1106_02043 [Curvularia clavata]|uniref:Uncharacterized protein n=1 Tax=Curvularia clavata TaxID=95742 RepID=A0A9Q9DQJ8_CURCL|nr:uncharacterized protein yc1106_02043 [Curvularia clavata]
MQLNSILFYAIHAAGVLSAPHAGNTGDAPDIANSSLPPPTTPWMTFSDKAASDRIYQVVRQISAMPSTSTPRGGKAQPCPVTPPTWKSVHETVTYPRIEVTAANNPCLDKSLSFEHVLACGHLILTAEPNEPCAPNCHHASVTSAQCLGTKKREIETTTAARQPFYCDACIETSLEALIPAGATAKQAEEFRTDMRTKEAKTLGKDLHYRKCYIGIKLTTVPCQTNGTPNSKYTPRKDHHAFDISIPQVGDNFFEDMFENEDDASSEDVKLTGACKRKRATETATLQRKRRKIVVDDDDYDDDIGEC